MNRNHEVMFGRDLKLDVVNEVLDGRLHQRIGNAINREEIEMHNELLHGGPAVEDRQIVIQSLPLQERTSLGRRRNAPENRAGGPSRVQGIRVLWRKNGGGGFVPIRKEKTDDNGEDCNDDGNFQNETLPSYEKVEELVPAEGLTVLQAFLPG